MFAIYLFLGSELEVINRKQFDSSNDELCRFSTGEYIRVYGNVRGVEQGLFRQFVVHIRRHQLVWDMLELLLPLLNFQEHFYILEW